MPDISESLQRRSWNARPRQEHFDLLMKQMLEFGVSPDALAEGPGGAEGATDADGDRAGRGAAAGDRGETVSNGTVQPPKKALTLRPDSGNW